MKVRASWVVVLSALVGVGIARGNVFGKDPRVVLDPKMLPEVGHLVLPGNNGHVQLCTATFVGRRTLLTAAHCVSAAADFNYSPAARLLGLQRQVMLMPASKAGSVPEGTQTLQSDFIGMGPYHQFPHSADWAFVHLDAEPTGKVISKFGSYPMVQHVEEGMSLIAVGYSRDREHGLSATVDHTCHVKHINSDKTFWTNCAFEEGASGGPLFSISVNGTVLTQKNEQELLDGDLSSADVQLSIAGIISAEAQVAAIEPVRFISGVLGGRIDWMLESVYRRSHFRRFTPRNANLAVGADNFASHGERFFGVVKDVKSEPSNLEFGKTSLAFRQGWRKERAELAKRSREALLRVIKIAPNKTTAEMVP